MLERYCIQFLRLPLFILSQVALVRTLCAAVECRETGVVETLLNAGAGEDLDMSVETPLHIASKMGEHRICSTPLDKGADVNCKCVPDVTPLTRAVLVGGDISTVRVLLEAGAAPNMTGGFTHRSAVHLACQLGDSAAEFARSSPRERW